MESSLLNPNLTRLNHVAQRITLWSILTFHEKIHSKFAFCSSCFKLAGRQEEMGWPFLWGLSARRGSQPHEPTKPFSPAVGTASPGSGPRGWGGTRQLRNWLTLNMLSPLPPSSPPKPATDRFLPYLFSIPLTKKSVLVLLNFNPGNGETQFAFGF